jgi:hypothetical protein
VGLGYLVGTPALSVVGRTQVVRPDRQMLSRITVMSRVGHGVVTNVTSRQPLNAPLYHACWDRFRKRAEAVICLILISAPKPDEAGGGVPVAVW